MNPTNNERFNSADMGENKMVEFIGKKEKSINMNDSIIFENKTKSNYNISTGVTFHKSGIYEVSIIGNKTIISEVTGRKRGKWINIDSEMIKCDQCGHLRSMASTHTIYPNFCENCGADMERG